MGAGGRMAGDLAAALENAHGLRRGSGDGELAGEVPPRVVHDGPGRAGPRPTSRRTPPARRDLSVRSRGARRVYTSDR